MAYKDKLAKASRLGYYMAQTKRYGTWGGIKRLAADAELNSETIGALVHGAHTNAHVATLMRVSLCLERELDKRIVDQDLWP